MTTLDSLVAEHQVIWRVLDAAERFANALDTDPNVDPTELRGFARFFTEFGELWHHAKEEEFLFAEMARHGSGWSEGPVAHARLEHEQEMYLGRVLVQLANQTSPRVDEPEHRREVVAAVRAYVDFQRHHVEEEEKNLYPRAREILPQSALDEVERRCHELEGHRFSSSRYDELCRLADHLVARYGDRKPGQAEKRGESSSMPALFAGATVPDLFARATTILSSHPALRQTIEELRALSVRLEAEDMVLIDGLRECLDKLANQLVVHFAAEEADGYFGTLRAESPQTLHAVERLVSEHREIRAGLRALLDLIGRVDEMELGRDIDLFIARLVAHEHDESALMSRFLVQEAVPRQ